MLVLTAREALHDHVAGLDGGGRLPPKPFSFAEQHARLRALIRRGGGRQTVLEVGDLTLDPATRLARHQRC